VPFGDSSCGSDVSVSWTEIVPPATSAVLTETVPVHSGEALYHWRARVPHARSSVTQSGITPPPNPAHGPWRRVSGQAVEADIRMLPEPVSGRVAA
jgi:hypothetical protein